MIFDSGAPVCVWLQLVIGRMPSAYVHPNSRCDVLFPSIETDERGMNIRYIARSSIVTNIIDPIDKINLEDSIRSMY